MRRDGVARITRADVAAVVSVSSVFEPQTSQLEVGGLAEAYVTRAWLGDVGSSHFKDLRGNFLSPFFTRLLPLARCSPCIVISCGQHRKSTAKSESRPSDPASPQLWGASVSYTSFS